MARSALERTGLIRDIEDSVNEPGEHTREIDVVIKTIRDFIEGANDTSFQVLFDLLTGRELGIGLRRGPLPLFLAFVLRDYRDEVKITRDGEERPLSEETLDDLSKRPDAYALTRINWSPEMGEYISELSRVFSVKSDSPSRADLAEAMRLWFAGLPQMTRNCRYDHTTDAGKDRIPPERDGFFRAIRRIDTDTDKLLFEELPGSLASPSAPRHSSSPSKPRKSRVTNASRTPLRRFPQPLPSFSIPAPTTKPPSPPFSETGLTPIPCSNPTYSRE